MNNEGRHWADKKIKNYQVSMEKDCQRIIWKAVGLVKAGKLNMAVFQASMGQSENRGLFFCKMNYF